MAIPSSVTLLGILFGMLAILLAATDGYAAGLAIIGAALCDMVDGRLARMTGTQSTFGAELDSLADIVSFGLAPSMLIYHHAAGDELSWPWLLGAFAFVACGALRLARFNVDPGDRKDRFRGLPIPAAALLLASLVMAAQELGRPELARPEIAAGVLALAAAGMVSPLPFPSYKAFQSRVAHVSFYVMVAAGLSLLVIGGPGGAVLFALLVIYAVSGFVIGASDRRAG
jgi:CDP-diacylglycerol--serine O-phosphatidyltransferase